MFRYCGFLVAPSGRCFGWLRDDEPYRRAMMMTDVAIADGGLMVLLSEEIWHDLIRSRK
jgi:hypothetical protein